jgi:hypothetical protein
MNRNRRHVRCDYLFSALEADAPAWACKIPAAPIKKLIPNRSVLALTARTWTLQNCMPLIPKTKRGSESGFSILSNLFIFNNMAERVGLCSDQFQKSQQQWKNRSIPLRSQILLELLQ